MKNERKIIIYFQTFQIPSITTLNPWCSGSIAETKFKKSVFWDTLMKIQDMWTYFISWNISASHNAEGEGAEMLGRLEIDQFIKEHGSNI